MVCFRRFSASYLLACSAGALRGKYLSEAGPLGSFLPFSQVVLGTRVILLRLGVVYFVKITCQRNERCFRDLK